MGDSEKRDRCYDAFWDSNRDRYWWAPDPEIQPGESITEVEEKALSDDPLHLAGRETSLVRWQLFSGRENLFDGLWHWNVRENKVAVDTEVSRRFGLPSYFSEFRLVEWGELIHPNDLANVQADLLEFSEGQASRLRSEYRIRSTSRKPVWVRAIDTLVVRNPDGDMLRVTGTFSNITALKEAEQTRLRYDILDMSSRFKASEGVRREFQRHGHSWLLLLENSSDPVFLLDEELRYVFVNRAMEDLLGVEIGTTAVLSNENLFGKKGSASFAEICTRVLGGECLSVKLTRYVHGRQITSTDSLIPWLDVYGRTIGIIGCCKDIETTQSVSRGVVPFQVKQKDVMAETMKHARMVAKTDVGVLLTGESGSGKDWLARWIHKHSKRSQGPYFAINCAAISKEMAESELFGHEAGAFTSATNRKRGLLELAEGGTLLLNEIGELPLELQAKLFTFFDTLKLVRVGGQVPIRVNARLIAATNRDLETEVSEGRFRQELLFRLNQFRIRVPPLRERLNDIPALIKGILPKLATKLHLPTAPDLDRTAIQRMCTYDWPGNIRELENCLGKAMVLSGGGPITPDLLGLPDMKVREQALTEGDVEKSESRGEEVSSPPPRDTEFDTIRDIFHGLSPEDQGYHLDIMVNRLCGGQSGAVKYAAELVGRSNKTVRNRLKLVKAYKKIDEGNPGLGAEGRMRRKMTKYLVDEFLKQAR